MQIKTILPFLYLLITATVVPAQQIVKETEKSMSFGNRPCFRIEFPGANTAILEEQWKAWALKNHSAKLKKKGGEWFATELKSKQTGEPYAVYSTIETITGGAALNVWFDLGQSFLNSRDNPSQAKDAKKALQQFYYDIRRATYDEQIKNEEAKLKLMEDNNMKLEKLQVILQKSISDYQAKIKKTEEEIAKNAKDQENALLSIDAQRKQIDDLKKRKLNVESEGH